MKRVFGMTEAVFDIMYLISALVIALILIVTGDSGARTLAGLMALVLVGGDAFHLVPRILTIAIPGTGAGSMSIRASGGSLSVVPEDRWQSALGRGKQITSITMTVFYLLLWHVGLMAFGLGGGGGWTYAVYAMAAVRIVLCLLPQNKWRERYAPVSWGIWRNVPFFLQGITVAALFLIHGGVVPGMGLMWLAIILSFAFYLPVVLWVNKNARIGMLMLPKTCMYIWMLAMCLCL